MAGILFLRDIEVDIQMRCRDCGHEGLLARGDLERRFGPNYPVLSIAPHYRCSRCNSKDVESSPGPLAAPAHAPLSGEDADSVDASLAALQGLLSAVRGDRPSEAVDEGEEEGEYGRDLPAAVPEPPAPRRHVEHGGDDVVPLMASRAAEPSAEEDLFERTLAALRMGAPLSLDDDDGEDADGEVPGARKDGGGIFEPEPEPEPLAAAGEASPFDLTIAALRDLSGEDEPAEEPGDQPGEEPEPVPVPEPEPDIRALLKGLADDIGADEPGADDEEDGEPVFRPRTPEPTPTDMEQSLAALRALVEKAAEDGPGPGPGPDPEPEDAEPDAPARAEADPDGDEPFDETIAALRNLIAERHQDLDGAEDAFQDEPADEVAEEEADALDDIPEAEILSFAIRDPDLPPEESDPPAAPAADDEDEPFDLTQVLRDEAPPVPLPPAPAPAAKSAHLNETLAKLRGMLELDRPDKDGGPDRGDGGATGFRPRRR